METADGAGGGALLALAADEDERLDELSFGWRPGFEAGDPRRGPMAEEMLAKAEAALEAPGRWHRTKGCDWMGVQLAYGRGAAVSEIEARFGAAEYTVLQRARRKKWTRRMSEPARRELSALVWHAGFRDGPPETEAERALLLWASEWRRVEAPAAWTPDASWCVEDAAPVSAARDRDGGTSDGGCERDVERAKERDRAEIDRAIASLEELAERVERQILDEQARGNPVVDRAAEDGAGGGDA